MKDHVTLNARVMAAENSAWLWITF